jgi:hypothetical protein
VKKFKEAGITNLFIYKKEYLTELEREKKESGKKNSLFSSRHLAS